MAVDVIRGPLYPNTRKCITQRSKMLKEGLEMIINSIET
jgi:hypothetical protein